MQYKMVMKRITTLLFFILCTTFQLIAQTQFKDLIAQTQFKDYIVADSVIWALTIDGKLKLFDIETGKQSGKKISNNSEILLISKDKLGNIVIVDKNSEINKWSEQLNSWEVISRCEGTIYGILFSSKNKCYAIMNFGIRDVESNEAFVPKYSMNSQITYKGTWRNPSCYFIDKRDNIWIGFDYGEWGGDLFVFNSTEKKYLTPSFDDFEMGLSPVRSFFEDSFSVYLSSGLDHLYSTSGDIVRFDNFKPTPLFSSDTHWNNSEKRDSFISGEYIGPAVFNYFNNSIYYYSQYGIFSGNKTLDLSKKENWKLVVKPSLLWYYGQPMAAGSAMNVLKITIIDKDKLIFLSQLDGIGLFDGVKLTMMK